MPQELLAMVPQPVKAVIMCYPITDATEAAAAAGKWHRSPQLLLGSQRTPAAPQQVAAAAQCEDNWRLLSCATATHHCTLHCDAEDEKQAALPLPTTPLFYLKQTIGNACGTIAIIHTLCNTIEGVNLGKHASRCCPPKEPHMIGSQRQDLN
jgi:hypothetical protein